MRLTAIRLSGLCAVISASQWHPAPREEPPCTHQTPHKLQLQAVQRRAGVRNVATSEVQTFVSHELEYCKHMPAHRSVTEIPTGTVKLVICSEGNSCWRAFRCRRGTLNAKHACNGQDNGQEWNKDKEL
jgi:hypothetical protein